MALNVHTEKRSGHIVLTSNDINDIPELKEEIDKFMARVRVGDIFKFRLEMSFDDSPKSQHNGSSKKHTKTKQAHSLFDAYCKELKVTMRDLGLKLDVSRATLYNIMKGAVPNKRTRHSIAMNAPTAELRESTEKFFELITSEKN
jgi:DNA-binding XRE family transcriptional regulator